MSAVAKVNAERHLRVIARIRGRLGKCQSDNLQHHINRFLCYCDMRTQFHSIHCDPSVEDDDEEDEEEDEESEERHAEVVDGFMSDFNDELRIVEQALDAEDAKDIQDLKDEAAHQAQQF